MIRLESVGFTYGGHTAALTDVSLEVEPGRMLTVLGSNGSGKSTMARLMNGLLLPSSGRVTVDGIDTAEPGSEIAVRSKVAMVFQNPDDQIVATSVEDDVAFGPENLGLERSQLRERVDSALADTGLTGLEHREPHLLSGGQRQRLAIAGALAMRPGYLVLDEPTSMIDAQGKRDVSEVLDRLLHRGQAIVLVSHDVMDAVRADSAIVLAEGRIAFSGEPLALLSRAEEFPAWGLEVPPLLDLTARLLAAGLDVPHMAADARSVAEALCR